MLRSSNGQRVPPCPRCRGCLVPSEDWPGFSHCLNCGRDWDNQTIRLRPPLPRPSLERPAYVIDHYDELENPFCEQLKMDWAKPQSYRPITDPARQ